MSRLGKKRGRSVNQSWVDSESSGEESNVSQRLQHMDENDKD